MKFLELDTVLLWYKVVLEFVKKDPLNVIKIPIAKILKKSVVLPLVVVLNVFHLSRLNPMNVILKIVMLS
jgi:hypothetical protein